MYRVSPFTYLVGGMLSTGLANVQVTCADIEYSTFNPPSGQSCGEYLQRYISVSGGYVTNANATQDCQFCSVADTNTYLASVSSRYSERWRNFGIMWAYIAFNVCGAIFLYWLARVPRKRKTKE